MSNSKLADELEKLCCAETEGKFFDLVTDSIGTILTALRAAPPSVALDEVLERIIDATNGINGNSALCWLRLADVRKIAETALTRPQPEENARLRAQLHSPGGAVAGNEKDPSNDPS